MSASGFSKLAQVSLFMFVNNFHFSFVKCPLGNTQDHPGYAGGQLGIVLEWTSSMRMFDNEKGDTHMFTTCNQRDPSFPPGLKHSKLVCYGGCLYIPLLLTEMKRKAGLSISAWRPLNLETAVGCCLQLWPVHWMDSASKATE